VLLLREKGVEPEIIEYLKNPADESILRSLAEMMGLRPNQFIRKGEAEFKALNLKDSFEDDDFLFSTMAKHPKLMERPIAVSDQQAVLGRPPEKVLRLVK
jgi:arsenate reductase|tara:strand:+ start:1718 stop:2017 length:300 start_codon:yes stop_codon:yes gene_type:complete